MKTVDIPDAINGGCIGRLKTDDKMIDHRTAWNLTAVRWDHDAGLRRGDRRFGARARLVKMETAGSGRTSALNRGGKPVPWFWTFEPGCGKILFGIYPNFMESFREREGDFSDLPVLRPVSQKKELGRVF